MIGQLAGAVRLLAGRGAAAEHLSGLLAGRRVLVVTSPRTAARTDLHRWLPAGATLFTEFRPNPRLGEALSAARMRESCRAEVVLGFGGGSALDVAKAARALPGSAEHAEEVLAGRAAPCVGVGLVLAPTTAGTGSEVTRFATLYRDGRKVSLDAAGVAAEVAVVDPGLTDTCPPALTWSCAFDALAHAVESYWSTRATARSRSYAEAALVRLLPVLRDADALPTAAQRDQLSEAGTLAGHAIDLTRTTAAHAMAYPLTVHLGVPHGLACALNLTWLAPLVEAEAPAGTDTLRRVFDTPPGGLGPAIRALLAARGLATELKPVDAPLAHTLVAEGLASNRVAGTPISLSPDRVRRCLATLWEGSHA